MRPSTPSSAWPRPPLRALPWEQNAAAAALLAEVLATPGARAIQYYGICLPTMVRTALGLGDRRLAERVVDGYESTPSRSPPSGQSR